MERIRFTTARDVFESFETAAAQIGVEPTDEAPLVFLERLLVEKKPLAALSFCAYLLPRRECVWWASQSIRHFEGDALTALDDRGLTAAEAWVREPSEARRRAALRTISEIKGVRAGVFCARAAGWSGGSKSLDERFPDVAEPHATSEWARQALLQSVISKPVERQSDLMAAAAKAGGRFAAGGTLEFTPTNS